MSWLRAGEIFIKVWSSLAGREARDWARASALERKGGMVYWWEEGWGEKLKDFAGDRTAENISYGFVSRGSTLPGLRILCGSSSVFSAFIREK